MANLIITRVQYCETCHKNKRPVKGELFVTVGRKHQRYQPRYVERFGVMGFTPHIIEFKGSAKGIVTYTSYCAMNSCGCKIVIDEENGRSLITPIEYTTNLVTLKEWNDLVLFKDDPDYWLD